MSEEQTMAVEILETYYDALTDQKWHILPEVFVLPATLIGLYGYRSILTETNLIDTYTQLISDWQKQGISPKIGHDPLRYDVQKIQENVVFVRNTLTNYDLNGTKVKKWNCSYTIVEANGTWKILSASSDNASSLQNN
jgi:hypothetical protein